MRELIPRIVYRGVVLLGVALLVTPTVLLSAQESSNEPAEKATRIALGAVSGAVKSQVMVPVFVTPYPPENPVGAISAIIEYPNKGITFLKAEKSFLLDGVNGSFQAGAEKDPKDPGKSVIKLEVATKGEPRKPLREGLILTLVFRIEPDAAPSTTVTLKLSKTEATNLETPPKAIQPLAGKNGTIEILAPEAVPYVGCFFFSH